MSTDNNELANQKCEVCAIGAPQLTEDELTEVLQELSDWEAVEIEGVKQLKRRFVFGNYQSTMGFVNEVAELSEEYNHHPAMLVEWGKVEVCWWTHKIHGLHKTDAIMAAKTDKLYDITK